MNRKHQIHSGEHELLRRACERLPESGDSPAFAARVMASVVATPQSRSVAPFVVEHRTELLGALAGLTCGCILAVGASLSLNSDTAAARLRIAMQPISASVIEEPAERYLWTAFPMADVGEEIPR